MGFGGGLSLPPCHSYGMWVLLMIHATKAKAVITTTPIMKSHHHTSPRPRRCLLSLSIRSRTSALRRSSSSIRLRPSSESDIS